jgi:hypothetical protein
MHVQPLTRAGLRYFVAEAADGSVIVGQRLKRLETIHDKLERMSLSRMDDLGGCRAVLPDQAHSHYLAECGPKRSRSSNAN